ncbi:MAG: tRNA (N6-threonylcarbamoyladenosine(37)-N6)-methyltransferase TrmO [Eubacterium sp.]|nr:tRNA (N6-threonylcarbamoyladenosine(37)-N6)-methyltransferase TrmO [Eubacterium sp.]
MDILLHPIAYIHTDFPEKFGIPRQSNVVETLEGQIVFTEEFRNPDYLRGIEDYSHIWLIWGFSANEPGAYSPTVRPPRLGGNIRKGLFATRSPFRPNPLGMSCVRLQKVEWDRPEGPVLHVLGADMMDGTPIYDIKPYIPGSDSYPEASEGISGTVPWRSVEVEYEESVLTPLPDKIRMDLVRILEQDPRPSYQDDPDRIYGMYYAGYAIRFQVKERKLRILEVSESNP